MIMAVVMMTIAVIVVMVRFCGLKSAHTRAERIAERTICDIRAGSRRALPFYVVVVRFLDGANFAFKSQHLGPVFAQHASWRWCIGKRRVLFAHICGDSDLLAAFHRQYLGPVGAGATVWRRVLTRLLNNPFSKGLQHLGVVTQVARFDELNVRIFGRNLIGETVNAVDQDARE